MLMDTKKLISAVKKELPLYTGTTLGSKATREKQRIQCWYRVGKAVINYWNRLSARAKQEHTDMLEKKWKNLRDDFVRQHRVQRTGETRKGKRFCRKDIYEQLLFLGPHTRAHKLEAKRSEQKKNSNSSIGGQPPRGELKKKTTIKNVKLQNKEHTEYKRKTNYKKINVVKQSNIVLRTRYQREKEIQPPSAEIKENASKTEDKSTSPQKIKKEVEVEIDTSGNRSFLLSCLPCLDSLSLQKCLEVKLRILKDIQEVTNQDDTKPKTQVNSCSPLQNASRSSIVAQRINKDADIVKELSLYMRDPTIGKVQSITSLAQDSNGTELVQEMTVNQTPDNTPNPYPPQDSTLSQPQPIEINSDGDEAEGFYELIQRYNKDIKHEFGC